MSEIQGTNIASGIAPFSTEDTYPTHDSIYGKGGWREVSTLAERDAIPAARLRAGCICYVLEDTTEYLWNGTGWGAHTPGSSTLGGLDNVADGADGSNPTAKDVILVKRAGSDEWTAVDSTTVMGGGGGSTEPLVNVRLTNNLATRALYAGVGRPCYADFVFVSQTRASANDEYEDTYEYGTLQIYARNGAHVTQELVGTKRIQAGINQHLDISGYLTSGENYISLRVLGELTQELSAALTYTVQLTDLTLSLNTFEWWNAFISTSAIRVPFTISGNIDKTLHVAVTGPDNYSQDYSFPLGSTVYVSPAYWGVLTHPGVSGVYNISAYVVNSDGTLQTETVSVNIICVTDGDAGKYMAVNEVVAEAVNYAENTLFTYSIYDGGNVYSSALFKILKDGAVVLTSTESRISCVTRHPMSVSLDINTVDSSDFDITVRTLELDGTTAIITPMTIPVNNSSGYAAAPGIVFYMNPRSRNNNQSNHLKVINEMTASELSAVWTAMNWYNDGWTVDADGRSILRIMAGSSADIPYKPFSGNEPATYGKTIELEFLADNVTNFDYPILKIASADTATFVGLKIYPEKVVFMSSAEQNEDAQSVAIDSGKRVHIALVILPNVDNISGFNVCALYVNGVKNREFTYNNTDYFTTDADIVIGGDYADIDVYGIRIYDGALSYHQVLQNYVNWITDNEGKAAITAQNDILAANGQDIDYDRAKAKYNVMVFDNTIPSKANGAVKATAYEGTLELSFHDNPERNVRITNVKATGQGTSSMAYYRWNTKYAINKTTSIIYFADGSTGTKKFSMMPGLPKASKFTAKKNFASSMQSHKIGSVNSVNDLYLEMGLSNEAMDDETTAGARVSVYQVPFLCFQKQAVGEEIVYNYQGLYTFGPDKGDSGTFGYDTDTFPGLISIEGSDNSPLLALFRMPWNTTNGSIRYNEDEEAFQYRTASGWMNSWDFDGGDNPETDIAKFIPAYNLAYQCSDNIKPYDGTLAALNAEAATRKDESCDFWIALTGDPDYGNVYFYDEYTELFVASDIGSGTINLITQLVDHGYGLATSDLAGKTADQLNALFISARIAKFRAEASAYWDIDDAIFHRNWVEFHAATDNRAKNTYPYNFGTANSKWKWRYDDLDTIFDLNNQGQAKKEYGVEVYDDYTNGDPVWNGSTSAFWNLIDLAFPAEITEGMKSMMDAMVSLGGSSSNSSLEKMMAYFIKYYFSNAQEYFPQVAYNQDAYYAYELAKYAYNTGGYTNDTDPMTQALGDHYSAEWRWLEKRCLYMMSKYGYGLFGKDEDYISIRAAKAQSITYELTPAIDMYPAIKNGTSIQRGSRTRGGQVCTMVLVLGNSADQQNNIEAASYLQDIGDWWNKNVKEAMIIKGRMLREIRLGNKDKTTAEMVITITSLTLPDCVSLQKLVLSNISTLQSTLDLSVCTHLKEVYADGTRLTNITLPSGGCLQAIEYGSYNQYVRLQNFPLLTNAGVILTACLTSIVDYFVVECPQMDPMALLMTVIAAQQPQGASHVLKHVRVVRFNEVFDSNQIALLGKLAESGYSGLGSTGVSGSDAHPVLEGTITTAIIDQTIKNNLNAMFPTLTLIAGRIVNWISFEDPAVEAILVAASVNITNEVNSAKAPIDTDGDEHISYEEAAAVVSLSNRYDTIRTVLSGNGAITKFNEFRFFTGVTILGGNAFNECYNLTEVTLPPSILEVKGNIGWKSAIRRLVIPEGCTTVYPQIRANDMVDGHYVYPGYSYVELPSTVTSLNGGSQFLQRQCSDDNLLTLVCKATTPPPLAGMGMANNEPDLTIYVPDDSVLTYKAATGWSSQAQRIFPLSQM